MPININQVALLRLILVPLCLFLASCSVLAKENSEPAVISSLTPEIKNQLEEAVSSILMQEITLGEKVLTKRSLLYVKTKTGDKHVDIRGVPEVFVLVLKHNKCLLIHKLSGTSRLLKGATCRAVK